MMGAFSCERFVNLSIKRAIRVVSGALTTAEAQAPKRAAQKIPTPLTRCQRRDLVPNEICEPWTILAGGETCAVRFGER
jgi:hypothetical protein